MLMNISNGIRVMRAFFEGMQKDFKKMEFLKILCFFCLKDFFEEIYWGLTVENPSFSIKKFLQS